MDASALAASRHVCGQSEARARATAGATAPSCRNRIWKSRQCERFSVALPRSRCAAVVPAASPVAVAPPRPPPRAALAAPPAGAAAGARGAEFFSEKMWMSKRMIWYWR